MIEQNRSIGSKPLNEYKLGGKSEVNLITQNGFEDLFKKSDISNINQSIEWKYNCPEGKQRIVAPISKGQVLGILRYTLDGVTLFETNLLATEPIEKRTIINTIVYRAQNDNFLSVGLQIAAGIITMIFILRFAIKLRN